MILDPTTTKVVSGAASQLAPEAKGLLVRLLGPTFDEWGIMLRDAVVARRRRNFERVAARASQRLGTPDAGTTQPELPTKTIAGLIEGASLEDGDPTLENQWAGLLASAAAGCHVPSNYPSLLMQLTSTDAALLNAIGHAVQDRRQFEVGQLGPSLEIPADELLEAVDNLLRLRLCVLSIPGTGGLVKRPHLAVDLTSHLELTTLGRNFLQACGGPKP